MSAPMRATLALLSSLAVLACQAAPERSTEKTPPAVEREPELEKPLEPSPTSAQLVRKDLLAEDLPPVPTLESVGATLINSGELPFPEGADELAPRAALALGGGLLLAGQAYHDRQPGKPSQSWRWTGFVPTAGEPRSTLHDPGAIRAGIVVNTGGLLAGTRGLGFEARGWFAKLTPDGTITDETAIDTPSLTEMFDLLPGSDAGELAVLGGYVDAQGYLISLDASGQRRWEKFISSHGQTQVRAFVRLDGGELLTVGSRAQEFGEAWFARAPGNGGESAAPDDVTQTAVEIDGADTNRMLRAIVEVGEAGYVALGTAKRNHLQAHDQLFAVGIDPTGKLAWSRVLEGVRATEVLGARGHAGAAMFVVTVPLADTPQSETAVALALVQGDPSQADRVRRLDDGAGWTSAGFVEGSAAPEVVVYQPTKAGLAWRRLTFADL
jgi:hypothetical protein